MLNSLAIALPPFIAANVGWFVGGLIVLVGLFVLGLKDTKRFSWKRIWAIASVSFDESIRRRVLWIIPLAILGVIIVSQLQHPVDEQDAIRQTTKFCLFATGLVVTITTIILACTNLPREIENRVIYTIVTKPATRLEIITGKVVGFSRVSLTILIIMGLFSYGYLSFRSATLHRAIGERLEAKAAPAALIPTLRHYHQAGLLNAKTLETPDGLQVFGREPDPASKSRWFRGGGEGGFVVPFDLTPEMLLPNATHQGMLILAKVGYDMHAPATQPISTPTTAQAGETLPYWGPFIVPPEQRHRPPGKRVTPQIAITILNANHEAMAATKDARPGGSLELNNPKAPSLVPATVEPNNVGEIARKPQRIYVQVLSVTAGADYFVDAEPVSLKLPTDNPETYISVKPAHEPIFISRSGTYGLQLHGGDPASSPVAIYNFRNARAGNPSQAQFELKVGIERSGDELDVQAEAPTNMQVRIRNQKTGQISEPVIITPESNRPTFFNIPAAAIGDGNFDVMIRTLTKGHFAGLMNSSLQMVTAQQSFALNLARSLFILWLMSILVTAVSIFCSTFLSWPIAVVLTIVILLGHWGVMQLGDATQPGIGNQIVQDLFKDTNAVQAKAVSATVEKLSSMLNMVSSVLPDISRFSAVEDIERGITIPLAKVGDALAIALGFGLPLIVLAYIFLLNKEVAP